MSNPYVGEIRMFAGNFAPVGWAFCDGSLMAISENTTLFELIGTTYGGDGQQTFAMPDLRGRIPLHQSSGFIIGQTGGSENVTLTASTMPAHAHGLQATATTADTRLATGQVFAKGKHETAYATAAPVVAMNAQAIGVAGSGLAHNNVQPFLCVSFIISLFGIFPSQS